MQNTKAKKVLHVVGAMNRAGTETMLMNLYRNTDQEKIQFDFISYSKKEAHYDEEIQHLNGKVIRLTKTNSIKQIYDAIKKHGPYDVVHAHTLFHCGIANLAAFLTGVKIRIAHAHTTSDKEDSYLRKLYIIWMRLFIYMFSTNLLACSKEAGKYLFGKKNVMNEKITYFPNIIDYSKFLKVPSTEVKKFKLEQGLGKHRIVIGHIGTFKASKNHKFIMEVMQYLVQKEPIIHLMLIGDGELKQEIQTQTIQQALTNHVTFIGNSENIPTILHSMDVFVFPSIYEGLGLVLLEAQASGIPCIVSEAIQPEADLGLGLLEKVPLAKGPEIWAERIIQAVTRKKINTNKITKAFENSGYSITKGMAMLHDLYKVNVGGAYEQDFNRLR